MSMKKIVASVVSQKQIGSDVFDMILNVGDVAAMARPGQFISMYSNDKSKLLPRPISICGINAEEGTLRVVYRAVGEGTKEFSQMVPGQTLDVIGPLGNGFTMKDKKAILFGGGIGIPPMLELAKQLNCDSTAVLGYRDEIFLADEFEKVTKVAIASEDGKTGYHLEIVFSERETAKDFCNLLAELELIARYVERKETYVVYIKSKEIISDFLSIIGATHALKKFSSLVEKRDQANHNNRAQNCMAGNADKTAIASVKQVIAIEKLQNWSGYDDLAEDLKELATLRKENPAMSLQELADHLKLSKSCINHRMRRLMELAGKCEEK